jgi:hypothetical protein
MLWWLLHGQLKGREAMGHPPSCRLGPAWNDLHPDNAWTRLTGLQPDDMTPSNP